jgi:uncharacterized protein (DUF58 family)
MPVARGGFQSAAARPRFLPSMETSRATRADLLDPAHLAALGRVEIIARWIVDGFMAGLHRSPRKGFSVEFAEYRPYLPGDDLRHVDWKIAARADRLVIKQYEEETNLRATIVLDVSRSMAWSGAQLPAANRLHVADRLTKQAYAEIIAASLALVLLRQRDAVGLVRFDDRVRSAVPPRSRRGHWRRLVTALDDPGSGLESSAPAALDQAGRLLARRGLVVLISDLLMDPDAVLRSVRGLRAAGHGVVVLHVLDPDERELPVQGELLFVDPESSLEVPATVADVRAAYRATVSEVIAEWRARLGAAGVGYEVVTTDQPFGLPLRRAFAARQSLP